MIISYRLLEREKHDATERDGLPRVARYAVVEDGERVTGEVEHMLYRDGGVVRSVPVADWPAEQERLAARDAAVAARAARRAALRSSIAGKRVDALTLPELRALVELLAEGLLEDGRVTPG